MSFTFRSLYDDPAPYEQEAEELWKWLIENGGLHELPENPSLEDLISPGVVAVREARADVREKLERYEDLMRIVRTMKRAQAKQQ